MNFEDLRISNTVRQVEWKEGANDILPPSFRGLELAGEAGEACNVLKKLERERIGVRGSRATLQDLADELADVIICADLVALEYGIDLGKAVSTKFNATSEKYGLKTKIEV